MSHWWCCCGRDCWQFTDNFDRASLGSDWAVLGGAWTIDSSDDLKCTTEGVLITTQRQSAPTRTGGGYNYTIAVDLVDFPALGGTRSWKIICGFVDVNNFDWVSMDYVANDSSLTPTFWRRTGGSDAKVMDPANFPGNQAWSGTAPETASKTIYICYADMHWSVAESPTGTKWEICGGGKANLPANASHGLFGFLGESGSMFDNLVVDEHWESNLDCDVCVCTCINPSDDDDYKCLSDTRTLTLSRTSGDACTELDGLSLTMYQSYPDVIGASPVFDARAEKLYWYSDTFMVESEKCWFVLVCDGGNYYLNVLGYPTLSDSSSANYIYFPGSNRAAIDWSESDCTPIFVFHDMTTLNTQSCDIDDPPPTHSGQRPYACASICWDVTNGETPRPPFYDATVT